MQVLTMSGILCMGHHHEVEPLWQRHPYDANILGTHNHMLG